MVHAHGFDDVVDVVQQHGKVSGASQHTGVGVDSHHTVGVGNGTQGFIILAAGKVKE